MFSINAYEKAAKRQNSNWDDYCQEKSQKIQFSNGNVSFKDYTAEYRSEGWLGRKLTALPKAALALVATIVEIANDFFDAVQNAFSKERKPLNFYTFSIVRGFEEAVGRLVMLFSDKYGSYLVDDAAFQRDSYQLLGQKFPAKPIVSQKRDYAKFDSPLVTRYASKEMSSIFSEQTKFSTWRKLWIALAESQQELGLAITDEQLDEMRHHVEDVNFERAEEFEKDLQHDVMSHIKAWGEQCPKAKGIIHLGATSCYVTDNTDLIQMRQAIDLLLPKLLTVISQLADLAEKYKDTPCLAQTHLQAAQPTTVGKRICLWLENFVMDYEELKQRKESICFLGSKGTTGTQASFLELFNGDHGKVQQLENSIAAKLGFTRLFPVTGQTYPRKQDLSIMQTLTQISVSAHKLAADMRVLAHDKEMEEPFGKSQIGSSAMAYKRNPMLSERVCAISRFVQNLDRNASETASWQFLERTLDDSANRRLVVPDGFLGVDSLLGILAKITKEPVVYAKTCEKHLQEELPFMATENILMHLVKEGKNRQEMHEKIRVHSQQAGERVKMEAKDNNLLELLENDKEIGLTKAELGSLVDVKHFIGRAPQQVEEYLRDVVRPLLQTGKK